MQVETSRYAGCTRWRAQANVLDLLCYQPEGTFTFSTYLVERSKHCVQILSVQSRYHPPSLFVLFNLQFELIDLIVEVDTALTRRCQKGRIREHRWGESPRYWWGVSHSRQVHDRMPKTCERIASGELTDVLHRPTWGRRLASDTEMLSRAVPRRDNTRSLHGGYAET